VKQVYFAFVVVSLGCASGKQRNEDFIPAEDAAKRSLDAYLSAWRAGDTSETLRTTKPPVAAADSIRSSGRTLEDFAILGPTPADSPRCFAVRLNLANPRQEVRERYIVVGIDPIWVIRHDDYEKVTHWCNPEPVKSTETAR